MKILADPNSALYILLLGFLHPSDAGSDAGELDRSREAGWNVPLDLWTSR